MTNKRGRPRVIADGLKPTIGLLHQQGMGYRTIAHILAREYGTNANWCTVRRILKEK